MFLFLSLLLVTIVGYQYSSIFYVLYLINCKRNVQSTEIIAVTNILMIYNFIEYFYVSYLFRFLIWMIITNSKYYYTIHKKINSIFTDNHIMIETYTLDLTSKVYSDYNYLIENIDLDFNYQNIITKAKNFLNIK